MDQLPLDGRITDLRAFARLGEEGVDLFLTDSTNAEVPGFTTSEQNIAPVLDRVFHDSDQRIIVATEKLHPQRPILLARLHQDLRAKVLSDHALRTEQIGERQPDAVGLVIDSDGAQRTRHRNGIFAAGKEACGVAGECDEVKLGETANKPLLLECIDGDIDGERAARHGAEQKAERRRA